jgi:hypothetical protein
MNPGPDSGSGSGADASVPFDPSTTGSVSVFNDAVYGGSVAEHIQGNVTAGFRKVVVAPTPNPTTTLGPCTLGVAGTTGGTVDDESAGALTVVGSSTVTVQDANGSYDQTFPAALFVGGSVIRVSASGAAVPAFTTTVATPPVPTLVAPAMQDPESATPTPLGASSDLTFTWTGGATGQVWVLLWGNGPQTGWASCVFPAAAGAGTVPQAVVQAVGASATYQLGVTTSTFLVAGGYGVTVSASEYGVLPDGHWSLGAIAFQ